MYVFIMLQAIIQFSVRNKLIIGLLLFAWIGYGVYSVTKLPIDAVPDITNNQVLIITSAPSLGAPDVERLITVPIEQATRNVPGIAEQRSFSRFGLSLVTIVFDDNTDLYWARQQISERLVKVQSQIPLGIATPELGPVTTGLGEIFQYVVRPKPGYEGKYSLADLRDIQDWIVRRQLLGTDGVADVSSFGGKVKQYEVAVNTDKLKSFQLTIADVFKAMNANNQNTGGAYIEKGPNVLFIRTEGLVQTLDDIQHIVVKQTDNGIPVLISDVADVRYGTAIRYGATVFNDKSEVAGAVVMMIKGGNSNQVIGNIKKRIKEIEKSLPEGVMIEPFLDRTKMVNNAISTVEKNLEEGALIVLFVLIVFLGNLRAGLIVASVIPLSMLFAVVMMNFFGVSGNLMSLGALDFGLLVDGAVIIVEAVMHKIVHSHAYINATKLNQHLMDKEVESSAGKMMSSAAFGQIVILIVYLPILSLQGIEGKMFKPMAETVSFAILGAFILSLTYVPMITSLLLSKKVKHKKNFSDKMIMRLQQWYKPVLIKVLKVPKTIVAISFIFFIVAVWLLTTLGGEFIPKLEEGDFAVDTRLLTGSSLTNTIATTEKTASVLLHQFPEVEKVVTKIGSGEIPTDPMPVEAADMMVILKDKKTWTSAKTFDELAEKMSKALEEVPGVATGFQFPVQMRFNELMTGARQDVVCKIFGDDLDSLAHFAGALGNIIQSVKGARDLYVETVTGVPQIVIHYNREAIAKYGANIADINMAVQAAYAGATAGLVFEGDKRYDLVIRLDENQRESISNIGNLQIGVANGLQIPLNNLASIEVKDGPYQIQREDAHRRITVGFNVRGRDVESIVNELHAKVEKQLKFPPGFYITYGGQYENLQRATKRLSIAVPIALILILLMLYFAFQNLKYALLIFSAIPLSAIGGVFALWLRGMPFSISAGVGFIALFGVAVLNGIVLIGEMNHLKVEGRKSIIQIIIQATQIRLRPVLMTASVASLGFLPMALSNGAGAEVQRPLATVVIGGLLTATLLTLLVLPSLYLLFETKKKPMKHIQKNKLPGALLLLLLFSAPFLHAQTTVKKASLQEITDLALQNAPALKVSLLQEKYNKIMEATSAELPKTQLNAELGNYNSMFFDSRIMVTQNFALPGYYASVKKLLMTNTAIAQTQTTLQKAEIKKLVEQLYVTLQYQTAQLQLLKRLDSIYSFYKNVATLRYNKGESNLLEKTTLENTAGHVSMSLEQIKADILSTQFQLQIFTQQNVLFEPADSLAATPILLDSAKLAQHPYVHLYQQQQQHALMQTKLEKAKLKPDFVIGYNNQSIVGWQLSKDRVEDYYNASSRFSSFSLGMGIPLFAKAQHARIQAASINEQTAKAAIVSIENQLSGSYNKYAQLYKKYFSSVQYYQTKGLAQANVLMQTASLQYQSGAINYIEWSTLVAQAIALQNDYLSVLYNQQMAVSEIHYLLQ